MGDSNQSQEKNSKTYNRQILAAMKDNDSEKVKSILDKVGLSCYPHWDNGNFLLRKGIESGHLEIVKLLISEGCPTNTSTFKNIDSPLHMAVLTKNLDFVEILIKNGAKIEAVNSCGETPLYLALYNSCWDIAGYLLDKGALIPYCDNSQWYECFFMNAKQKNLEIIKLLLEKVPSFECLNRYLIASVEVEQIDVVKLVLSHGADVNYPSSNQGQEGYRSLHIAAAMGNLELVNTLLIHGADVNVESRTGVPPVCLAVMEGHEEVVEVLLKSGSNINWQDIEGKTLLGYAVEKRARLSLIEVLIRFSPSQLLRGNQEAFDIIFRNAGKSVNDLRTLNALFEYGFSIADEALNDHAVISNALSFGSLKLLKDMVRRGVDIAAISRSHYYVPLCIASLCEYPLIIDTLFNHGFNIDWQDENGKTILGHVVEEHSPDLVNRILKLSPDIANNGNILAFEASIRDAKSPDDSLIINSLFEYGFTVNLDSINDPVIFHKCIEYGRLELVEDLVIRGADMNIVSSNYEANSPLHTALQCNKLEIAQLLIYNGTDLDAKDWLGQTPLFYAAKDNLEFVKLLVETGAKLTEISNFGDSCLYSAVISGNLEIVDYLLDHGIDVSAKGRFGQYPLEHVIRWNNLEMLELILKKGKNIRYAPLLYWAVNLGRVEAFLFLLNFEDTKYNIDCVNEKVGSLIHFAVRYRQYAIVDVLLQYGADMSFTNEYTDLKICKFIFADLFEWGLNINRLPTFIFDKFSEVFNYPRVKKFVTKLKVGKFGLSKGLDIPDYPSLRSYRAACQKEIDEMKKTTIFGNISYYEFLKKDNLNSFINYFRNEELNERHKWLHSRGHMIRFPIYYNLIRSKVLRTLGQKFLLTKCAERFEEYFGHLPSLPIEVTDRIFKYFADRELKFFCRAKVYYFDKMVF